MSNLPPEQPVYARAEEPEEQAGWALELARSTLTVALILALTITATALVVGDVALAQWIEKLQSLGK